jgi:hypothetical protein
LNSNCRYDRENEDPTHGPSSGSDNSNQSLSDLHAQETRAINLSIRTCEPLSQLNTNFSTVTSPIGPAMFNMSQQGMFWPKRENLSPAGFRTQTSPPPAVPLTGESPLDFSNWRLGSDYSVQRLFSNHRESITSQFTNSMPHLTRIGSDNVASATAESNRTALIAVAAAISAAAASAAVSAASTDRSMSVPIPSIQSPSSDIAGHRGHRHSRGPRRSAPSTLSSHPKSSSPTPTGANWKSRQPTECDFCKRMFSNKFNLKQVRIFHKYMPAIV